MRNVNRPKQKPHSLEKDGGKWKEDLLSAIKKRKGKKEIDKCLNNYNKPDIRDALEKMYNKLCCYCESPIKTVTQDHIEHRKPKSKYPELAFDWDNLHLACPNCNRAKADDYDNINPILDAVIDVPITEHYRWENEWFMPITKRGETTEKHADLNREDLLIARKPIYEDAFKVVLFIKTNSADPGNNVRIKQLKQKSKGPYGSIFMFLINTFLN